MELALGLDDIPAEELPFALEDEELEEAQGFAPEDESYREPVVWNEDAALEEAGKVAIMADDLEGPTGPNVAQELQRDGTSPTADAVVEKIAKENEVIKVVVASEQEDPQMGVELAKSRLQDTSVDKQEEVLTRLVTAFNPDNKSPEETLRREMALMVAIDDRWEKAKQFDESLLSNIGDFIGNVFPWMENLATARFVSKLEDKFDIDFGTEGLALVAGGEYLKKVRDWLDEMGDEERWEVTEAVLEAANDASGIFGANDFTKLQMLDGISNTRQGNFAKGINTDWARVLPTVVGVIDVIGLASLVKTVGKGGKAVYGSTIGAKSVVASVNRISKSAGARLNAQIIDGPEELAKMAGSTKSAVADDTLLYKADVDSIKPGVSETAIDAARAENETIAQGYTGTNLDKMKAQAEAIGDFDEVNMGGILSGRDKVLQVQARRKSVENAQGLHLAGNNSARILTDTDVTTVATFFKSSTEAFKPSTLKAGIKAAASQFPNKKVDVVEVLYGGKRVNRGPLKPDWTMDPPKNKPPKDPETGESFLTVDAVEGALEEAKIDLVSMTKKADKKKASAKIKEYEDYLKSDSAAQQRLSDDGPEYALEITFVDKWDSKTTKGFSIEGIVGSGTKAINLVDITAGLPQHVAKALLVAYDLNKASVTRMMDLIQPFIKAKNSNQKIINAMLIRGEAKGEVYTAGEIMNGLDSSMSAKDISEVVDGYISMRMFSNSSYVALNKMHYNASMADDLLSIESGGIKILGKPISDEVAKTLKVAWDPAGGGDGKGKLVKLTDDMLEGSSFYRSQQRHGNTAFNKTYDIIVRKDSGVDVGDLPKQLLTHRPGHISRTHSDLYILKKTPKKMMLDGKAVPEGQIPSAAVMTATSKKAGEALRDAKRLEDPDHTYELVYDRSLNPADSRAASFEVEYNNNGMYFGKRGDRLENELGVQADIVDPVGSIAKMATAVSYKINMEPVIAHNKAMFQAMFGKYLDPAKQGQFPLTDKDIGVAGNIIGKEKEIGKAKAYWARINDLETNGVISDRWRMWTIKAGEYFEGVPWAEKMGVPTWLKTTAGQRDPMAILRGAAFTSMISLNPARQLFLQSQQFLLLSGLDPVHVLSGATTRQAMPLMAAVLSKSGKHNKALAKAAGIEHDEFQSMVKGLKDSGMFDAVDEHLLGREALLRIENEITNSKGEAIRQGISNTIKSALNGIKTAGFDMGEMTNIAHTYVIARRRFAKKYPDVDLKSKTALRDIHFDARALALAMTSPGGFGYQKGWFSLGLQFFSVQHKAALFMLPAFGYLPGKLGKAAIKYGNSSVSKGEAARIATFQLGLFGVTGLGMQHMYDKFIKETGVEVSPEANAYLRGGLYDLAFNAIVGGITGEEVDVRVGDSIAAGSGYQETIARTLKDLGGEKNILELLFGPSANTISKTYNAIGQLRTVLGVTFGGGELPEGEVELTFDMFARIASGYNNYIKHKAGTTAGYWVAGGDAPTDIPTNATEQNLLFYFGLTGNRLQSEYEYFSDTKKYDEMVKKTSEEYYKRITMKYTELLSLPQEEYANELLVKALGQEAEFLRRTFRGEPEDFDVIMQKVGDLINQRADYGEGILVDKMAQFAVGNRYGAAWKELVSSQVRNKRISKEVGDTFLQARNLELLFGDEK